METILLCCHPMIIADNLGWVLFEGYFPSSLLGRPVTQTRHNKLSYFLSLFGSFKKLSGLWCGKIEKYVRSGVVGILGDNVYFWTDVDYSVILVTVLLYFYSKSHNVTFKIEICTANFQMILLFFIYCLLLNTWLLQNVVILIWNFKPEV